MDLLLKENKGRKKIVNHVVSQKHFYKNGIWQMNTLIDYFV
jgi:hypothetical protein